LGYASFISSLHCELRENKNPQGGYDERSRLFPDCAISIPGFSLCRCVQPKDLTLQTADYEINISIFTSHEFIPEEISCSCKGHDSSSDYLKRFDSDFEHTNEYCAVGIHTLVSF